VIPPRFYRRMYEVFLRQNCGRIYGLPEFTRLLEDAGFRIVHRRIVYGFWGELAWEMDKVCKEHRLERWKVLILPLLKMMSLLDIRMRNKKGAGMVCIVRKL
ncbi:MAG: hypothetical protein MJA29_04250, partial [Candidatus Omnitrophica bacterium]|nr:hypothetical protein [Candidatus Omnitrophota bacterium]